VELGRSKSESSGRDQCICERTLGRVCLLQRNEQVAPEHCELRIQDVLPAAERDRVFDPLEPCAGRPARPAAPALTSCRSSQKTGGVSSPWYRAMLELETRAELVMFALANGVIGPNAG
jgi:hypothetical protein